MQESKSLFGGYLAFATTAHDELSVGMESDKAGYQSEDLKRELQVDLGLGKLSAHVSKGLKHGIHYRKSPTILQ